MLHSNSQNKLQNNQIKDIKLNLKLDKNYINESNTERNTINFNYNNFSRHSGNNEGKTEKYNYSQYYSVPFNKNNNNFPSNVLKNNCSDIKTYNIETPYKNSNDRNYNYSDRKTYQITEKKIKVPPSYNRNTYTYKRESNRPDLNLNLGELNLNIDQPPNFNQFENKTITKPYRRVKIKPNINNNNQFSSLIDGNISVLENYNSVGYNDINLNLNYENFNHQNNSFDYYSPKSQSPAYRKKNAISYNNYKIIESINNLNVDNSKKNNFSLFREREPEIYGIYAKKIQSLFRGFISRKRFMKGIKISNAINLANNVITNHSNKNVFEMLLKLKNDINQNKNKNNNKPVYRKKSNISKKNNESFLKKRKNSNSGRIILVEENPEINYQEQLRKYELEISILKEENNKLRNHQSKDLNNSDIYNNSSNNIKVIRIENSLLNNSNDDILNSSFGNENPNEIKKLKNIYLKQLFWKKETMNQKILFKNFERWNLIIQKEKQIINKKEKILSKFIRSKDNYIFLFMKEQFKKFLFNGIMIENILLRKEQKKEFMEKVENEEKDEDIKKRKFLRFLISSKIRATNNILNQQFRKFYFNGLYNQMKNEKDIDIRKSMNIDKNMLHRVIKNNSNNNPFLSNENNDNEEKDIQENSNKEDNQKIFKKIIFQKNRKDKEFLHKCFIKFYYRGIYRELVCKKNVSSSSNSTSVISNSNITNSTTFNSNILNSNIINSNIEINNENNKETIKEEKKIEEIEKIEKKDEIIIEMKEKEIEDNNYKQRLEKARNLRKFLVNKEKEKKEKFRNYFYRFYKAGIVRLMILEGRKKKEKRRLAQSVPTILNPLYNTLQENNQNITPSITQSLLNSIEIKSQELKLLKLENIFYKTNRKRKALLKSTIKNWNIKSKLLKIKRAPSGIKKKKSKSKKKNIPSKSPEDSKIINPSKKMSNKIKSKQIKTNNLIPKSRSQVNIMKRENENYDIEKFIKIINDVLLIHYKSIFYKYLKDL